MSQELKDERAAFEAWAADEYAGRRAPDAAWIGWKARAAQPPAAENASDTCAMRGGSGVVPDGEITGSGCVDFENGPVRCVKDCPACASSASEAIWPPPGDATAWDEDGRVMESVSSAGGMASKSVISAAENLIAADRAQALTTEHVNALENAIAMQHVSERTAEDAGGDEAVELLRRAHKALACAALTQIRDGEKVWSEIGEFLASARDPAPANKAVGLRLTDEQREALQEAICWARDDGLPGTADTLREILAATQPSAEEMTAAARDVLAERKRQMSVEGWTPEHDDDHDAGEMADAAASYALHASGWTDAMPHEVWPADWSKKWWKPTTPRRDLVKAGALIIAEIERIDRAASAPANVGGAKHAD